MYLNCVGELLGRTSCGCTDDWLALISGWSHCTGSTACSGSSGCSISFDAPISRVAGSTNFFMWAILRPFCVEGFAK